MKQDYNGGQLFGPFLDGLARIFDIRYNLRRPVERTGWEEDVEALQSDWAAIGNDMRAAMVKFEQEESEKSGKSG